jgi:hypothetical protein
VVASASARRCATTIGMAKYKRKTDLEIDAVQFDPTAQPWPPGVMTAQQLGDLYQMPLLASDPQSANNGFIVTPAGILTVEPGDYIINDTDGAVVKMKPDKFIKLYDKTKP